MCIAIKMDTAGRMNWQAKRLEGKVFTVRFIDSAGQIHLEETGPTPFFFSANWLTFA